MPANHAKGTLAAIPDERCLEALRHALKLVLAPEAHTPLAKHYVQLAEMVLARWIAAESRLPLIEGTFERANAEHLNDALELLMTLSPAEAVSTIPLPQALQRLTKHLPEAPAASAAKIRTVIRAAVATDAAARRAFEAAAMEVAGSTPASEDPKQFSIDRERLEGYLGERFAAAGAVKVLAVSQLPGGHSKETVLFEIDPHPRLPAAMVIRMDAGRYGTSVGEEYPLLVALHGQGLPVPEPLWLEERPEVFGGPFMVTRRMPGAPPGTLWDVGATSPAIALALADALARIHTTPLQLLTGAGATSSGPLVERMLADSEAGWRARMPKPSVAMEAAYWWMREKARDFDVPASLVHGDPGFQNMIVHEGRLQCLLDWEFAHAGDAAEDLAYCRPAIERVVPWADFVRQYRASGGQEVTEERLRFFEIWRCLRNATLAANVLHDVISAAAGGLEMIAVAVNTYPRLEAQLASSLEKLLHG